jgi:hypothetical protein
MLRLDKSPSFFTKSKEKAPHEKDEQLAPEDKKNDKALRITKKIKLADNTIPLSVDMYDPGIVVVCEPHDKIFLFTPSLAPCIAALLFCRIKSGKTIIGVAHLFDEDILDNDEESWQEMNPKEVISQKRFVSLKLRNTIEKIKNCPNYGDAQIDVHFAGGRGSAFDRLRQQLYCEYIKTFEHTVLKGYLFDPFGLNDEIEDQLTLDSFPDDFSTTAGITSDGEPIVSKTYDIYFSMEKFAHKKYLENYFKEHGIVMHNYPTKPDQTLPCFESLTLRELQKSSALFTQRGGYGYEYYVPDQKPAPTQKSDKEKQPQNIASSALRPS